MEMKLFAFVLFLFVFLLVIFSSSSSSSLPSFLSVLHNFDSPNLSDRRAMCCVTTYYQGFAV
jgi:hypothetical protein